ncbi:hypothetical protein P7K49_036506 [Saguinus oedipus]|uniref:Uncharacterized protein n=1 Tax=Saguinus oedipus TaxID=9490 RepID=A0ABQ9TKK5_SAGOE|nr:hypothetical protein P7K49_036506 [Saguinus oedipus]
MEFFPTSILQAGSQVGPQLAHTQPSRVLEESAEPGGPGWNVANSPVTSIGQRQLQRASFWERLIYTLHAKQLPQLLPNQAFKPTLPAPAQAQKMDFCQAANETVKPNHSTACWGYSTVNNHCPHPATQEPPLLLKPCLYPQTSLEAVRLPKAATGWADVALIQISQQMATHCSFQDLIRSNSLSAPACHQAVPCPLALF